MGRDIFGQGSVICSPQCRTVLEPLWNGLYNAAKVMISPSLLWKHLPKPLGTAAFDCVCSQSFVSGTVDALSDISTPILEAGGFAAAHSIPMEEQIQFMSTGFNTFAA